VKLHRLDEDKAAKHAEKVEAVKSVSMPVIKKRDSSPTKVATTQKKEKVFTQKMKLQQMKILHPVD
jgi:hypothetical protein